MNELIVQVYSGIHFGDEPLRLVEVALTYGDQRRDIILGLDSKSVMAQFTYDEKAGRTIGFRYTAYVLSNHPAMQSSAPSFSSAEEKTDASVIVIDPRQLYRMERPRAIAVFSFEKYRAAFVDVRATNRADGSAIATTLDLAPDQRERGAMLLVDSRAKVDLEYRVRHVAQAAGVLEGPWLPLDYGTIVVGEPALASIGTPLV